MGDKVEFAPSIGRLPIPQRTFRGFQDSNEIPLLVRLPTSSSSQNKCPMVLLITGLDGHRPDNTGRTDEFINRAGACVIAEIPSTADCPSDRRDPESSDRLSTAILDWMDKQPQFDMRKCIAWALSAGMPCAYSSCSPGQQYWTGSSYPSLPLPGVARARR
ncbi:hypothetical protein EDD37DRAFT_643771 [Exophiala viscosa]|uniref:uncharacterized protein n=1 Tax=Exophiala viscosa TaxID=2486360 RepID=UPI0021977091|nr:hypothetical protein EDD37DRAFT_643771 [Exophiala viscosa]